MKILLSILMILTSLSIHAQKDEPTTWTSTVSKKEVKKGDIVELIFTADVKKGWYLYSSDFDEDLGPVVATFRFDTENNKSYELVGDIVPVGAKSKYDDIWDGTYTYFSGKAEFRQKVKVLSDAPRIKVKLNAQACTEEDGKCVPVIKQFNFDQIKVVSTVETTAPEVPKVEPQKPAERPNTSSTTAQNKPAAIKSINRSDYNSDLDYLKAQKSQLAPRNKKGQDLVVSELKEFSKKYGGTN